MHVVAWLMRVGLLLLAAGCVAEGSYAERTAPGLMLDAFDEVTAGLDNHEPAADPAANPLAGAFFSDGKSGDIRGRSENYFGRGIAASGASGGFVDTDADGLPDTRVGADNAPEAPRKERMLVYRGQVRVEVARAEDAGRAFLAQVEAWGGYLQSQSGNAWTVRLPAARFEEAFAAVRAAGRVLSEQREADDVTEEFVDLGIRVDNARRSRERLLEVLKLAEKVEDILKVEAELRRLTEEIERMEGRLKFLRDQVAMATLRAEFQSVAEAPPVKRQRRRSRFDWINRIGAEAVMEGF